MVGSTSVGLRPIPLPVRTAVGGTWGPPEGEPIVLFAGCVSDVWFSGTHRAVIELLAAAGYRVTAPADQTCCGALAAHAGFDAEAQALASRNVEALQGEAIIVTDAAGCGAHLQSYDTHDPDGHSVARRAVDATDLVLRAVRDGRLPVLTEEAGTIAVQDPCHLEHGMRVVDAPRELLEAGGYTVIDADRGGLCCGAAGVYQLEFPRTSDELGTAKARAVTATGVTSVASANAGCEMQLRRFLGEGYRVAHPVEWYWERWRTQR